MSLFDDYWRALGLPLSRFKGAITDAIPFSVVEAGIWIGGAALIVLLLSYLRPRGRFGRKAVRLTAWMLGPVFLIALGLGQGAFPWSLAPTALRTPLPRRLGTDSLDQETFKRWVAERAADLRAGLGTDSEWRAYQDLDEHDVQAACDTSLDAVLADVGLLPGRHVRNFKNMGPLVSTLGLVYGGPAFHDPFFSEIGIVRFSDYPTPRHWRLIAACHETAHAKGFTREMDAEILTQLALFHIRDPRYRVLADIHFLQKSGLEIPWPDSLIAESRRMRALRRAVQAHQPVSSFLRRWALKGNIQNSSGKYGFREPREAWNPRHPFFATVHRAEETIRAKDSSGARDGK